MTPYCFYQVFAKSSLIKNIFEEEKSSIVEHDFLWKIVLNWVYFGQGEDFRANHGTVRKSATLPLPMLYWLSYEASTGGNLGSEVAVSIQMILIRYGRSNTEDLIRRSWVQTTPGPKFLWPVGTPKFPLIRVETQGIWCIGSIAYFRHLNSCLI